MRVQAVVLCGIQGSGRTTFYVERFLHTHVRISLDLLRTRTRKRLEPPRHEEGFDAPLVVRDGSVTESSPAWL